MKKRYITNKNMNLIHEKILLDYPELKGNPIEEPKGFENSPLIIEGDETSISITIKTAFDFRLIDDIMNNFNPIPRPKRKLTRNQLIDEIANEKGIEII